MGEETARTRRPGGFATGVRCGLRGVARCVTTPSLWAWAWAPALVTLAGFVLPFLWLRGRIEESLREHLPSAATALAAVVTTLVALVVAYLVFAPLARVVAAPFLALLSDRTMRDVLGAEPPAFAGGRVRRFVVLPLRDALVFLLVRGAVTLLLLPLLCLGPVGAALLFALLVPLEGLDRMDVAQSSRAVPLGRRLSFVRRRFGACAGLGTVAALLLLVPVANVLLLPGLAVGAVLLDAEVSDDFPSRAAGTGP